MRHRDVLFRNVIWGSFEHEVGAAKSGRAVLPQPGVLSPTPPPPATTAATGLVAVTPRKANP